MTRRSSLMGMPCRRSSIESGRAGSSFQPIEVQQRSGVWENISYSLSRAEYRFAEKTRTRRPSLAANSPLTILSAANTASAAALTGVFVYSQPDKSACSFNQKYPCAGSVLVYQKRGKFQTTR